MPMTTDSRVGAAGVTWKTTLPPQPMMTMFPVASKERPVGEERRVVPVNVRVVTTWVVWSTFGQ